jgi:hypothetical protein
LAAKSFRRQTVEFVGAARGLDKKRYHFFMQRCRQCCAPSMAFLLTPNCRA